MISVLSLMVSVTITAASATTPNQPVTSRQEINEAVAKRVFEEILSQGRFEVADEIYAKDFVNHGLHRDYTLEEDQAAARWEKQVAPDLKVTADLMVADEDFVTVVWTARGTNMARIGWLPATGVKFEERGITVWRVVDGKIHDEWTSFDELHILRQAAAQLKWQLMALLAACGILVWLVVRGFRRKPAANI
ncbi:MAG TPA: ester cyclase [Terriglobales bacterium]|nr:ester cyclase [Terriglobales bacterium]